MRVFKKSRWDSIALAISFVLAVAGGVLVVWLSATDEFRSPGEIPRLVLILGIAVILIGLAGYSVVSDRPVILSRAGTMAFVAGFFLSVVGFFLVAAGILWVVVAGRRGSPFIIDERMLAASVIWIGAFAVGFFLHDDPICVQRGITACTSDAVVWWEVIIGLGLGGISALVASGGEDPRIRSPNHRPVDTAAAS